MAMKKKNELKDIFAGPSTLMYQKVSVDLSSATAITLNPELELPVKVGSLKIEQGAPTLKHYKVIGMNGDWSSSAEVADFEVEFVVPTIHSDVLKWAHGDDAVKEGVQAAIGSVNYKGHALTMKKHKIFGSYIIEDDAQENLMILSDVALWARPMVDNDGDIYAIGLSGTIEVGDKPSIAWLKKQ